MSPPTVLILGAGLGGLALAQCLRRQNVPFRIFERSASLQATDSGWAIAVHSVLDQLEQKMPSDLPPLEETTSHLNPLDLGAQLCFYDATIEPRERLYVDDGPNHRVLRANRGKFRNWLCTNIPVEWDSHLLSIKQHDGKVELQFRDGSSVQGDLLVGADGVGSQVRSYLLPHERPAIVPMCVINGEVTLSWEDMQEQLALGHSSYVAFTKDAFLFVGLAATVAPSTKKDSTSGPTVEGGKYYWYLSVRDEPIATDSAENPHWTKSATGNELHAFAVSQTVGMHEKFRKIIHLTKPEDMRRPPLVFRDLCIKDLPDGNITLIGDAAHPMTPFRGEGGSQAMMDALKLAGLLTDCSSEYSHIVQKLALYKAEMLPRGREAVTSSRAVVEGTSVPFAWGQEMQKGSV